MTDVTLGTPEQAARKTAANAGKRQRNRIVMRAGILTGRGNLYYKRVPGFAARHLTSSVCDRIAMTNSQNLKSMGLKATFPRLKILDLFQKTDLRHLTAEDVYRQLINEGMDIGLATVYRVLTQFEQAGLLTRHYFESGKAVFELNEGRHHDHLVCMQCGKVEEFYDPEIEARQNSVAKERGFAVHEHALYLYADCLKPDCPNKKQGQQE
jgi:Fur family ferric uptake transcriptional regulator